MKIELMFRSLNCIAILMLVLTFCFDCRLLYPSIMLLILVEQFQILRIYIVIKKNHKGGIYNE